MSLIDESELLKISLQERFQSDSLRTLYEIALQLSDTKKNNAPRFIKPEFVSLLLCHAARTWRGTKPKVKIHIHVVLPNGKPALHLSL